MTIRSILIYTKKHFFSYEISSWMKTAPLQAFSTVFSTCLPGIGLSVVKANPSVNSRSKASVKDVFLVLSPKSASALPGVEVTVVGLFFQSQ